MRRPVEDEMEAALAAGERLLLLRGPRQTGKSSLLIRALRAAREAGARTALTDLRTLSEDQLVDPATLLRALAEELAEQLEMELTEDPIGGEAGPARSMRRFLRGRVLAPELPPVMWALDNVDHLLSIPRCRDVLGLFRAWYNERALDPEGPWSRLTVVFAYSTEVRALVQDLNQSPFNVGVSINIDDLTEEQVAEINRRHGSPARTPEELAQLRRLVNGHPGLLHRALTELRRGRTLAEMESEGEHGGGVFGGHLQHLWETASGDPELLATLRNFVNRKACPKDEHFLRLRSAGILAGNAPERARVRCGLYERFLRRRLRESPEVGGRLEVGG